MHTHDDVRPSVPAVTRTRAGPRTVGIGVGALALALTGCTLDVRVGPSDEATTEPALGGLAVRFDVTGRSAEHPQGKGPLLLEDPARIAELARGAGADVTWATRFRFPVDLEDTAGTTWQVDGFTEEAWSLVDDELAGDEPVALATDVTGPVTLLVPDLAGGGEPTEVTFDVVEAGAEDLTEEDDADEGTPARLYLNQAAFTALVEQAGRAAWADATRTTGTGGPAEPHVVMVRGLFPAPRDGDAQQELWDLLEAEGYSLPFMF